MFALQVIAKDTATKARAGELKTPHGTIQTPCFVPVGTQASVKGLSPDDLTEIGTQLLFANTYHLHLRPGEDTVAAMGGLSQFMSWHGPTITDSGGFQVFSLGVAQEPLGSLGGKKLSKFSKAGFLPEKDVAYGEDTEFIRQLKNKTQRIKPAIIDDEGVTFYSHLDGSKKRLDPESSIQMQEKIGADLIVAFDDHESPLWDYERTQASLERNNRWALASIKAHTRHDQLMYGVTHGGVYQDLREASAKFTDKHFGALAIGGAYTSKEILYKVIEWSVPYFAEDKPRHLLGIGEVVDLFEGIERGMDFFDCVAPTRRARHGSIYIHPQSGGVKRNSFTLQLYNEQYRRDKSPLDPVCSCYTCRHFTRGYIHHLLRARELLGYQLTSYHNVYFIANLVKSIRQAILEGTFTRIKAAWLQQEA